MRRTDEAALEKFARDPRAGFYLIGGELVVMKTSGGSCDPLFSPDEARAFGGARETVFLGLMDEAPRFGIGLDPAAVEPLKAHSDLKVTDLRSVSRCTASSPPSICRRSRKPRPCSAGTRGIASVPIAARRPMRWKPAGGAIARPARCSIFRAPIRLPSCCRSRATAACSAARRALRRRCIRASPASSSRARRSRRRCAAKCSRKWASFAGASNISPRSPGRSRCR